MTAVFLFAFFMGVKGAYLYNGVNYVLYGNTQTATVIELPEGLYTGNVTIANTISKDGITYKVTEIGVYAFKNCTELTSVKLSENLTAIRNEVFYGCTALTKIELPATLKTIGDYVFQDCSALASVTFKRTSWFEGNKTAIESIGLNAFRNCSSLTSIEIPSSVTYVGSQAFKGCTSLERVDIASLEDWCNIDFSLAVGENPVLCNAHYLYLNGKKITHLKVPAVETIKEGTFATSYFESVEIQEGTKSIERMAFAKCKTPYVVLPASLEEIGLRAFYDEEGLTGVHCKASTPPSLISNTFQGLDLSTMTLHVPQAVIGDYRDHEYWGAFGSIQPIVPLGTVQDGLLTYHLTPDMKAMVTGYDNSQLPQNLTIPATITIEGHNYQVTKIGENALKNANLNSITLPDGITEICPNAFQYSQMKTINLPSTITTIGEYAFYYCQYLTAITIPPNVKEIRSYTFSNCKMLPSITIPNSVETIGDNAFVYCEALKTVNLGNKVKSIGSYAYNECKVLNKIVIPNSVKIIGGNAFANCNALATLTFGSGLETIGSAAFSDCDMLSELTIPDNVTNIGSEAFRDCSCLKIINIGNGLKSLNERVFNNCTSIQTIRLGEAITTIYEHNFTNCPELQTVYCLATTPPNDDDWDFLYSNIFKSSQAANATLYVPLASIPLYNSNPYWNIFGTIKPIDGYPTKVENVENTENEGQWFDLTGRAVKNPQKGIYVKDGKKILVK